MSEEITKEKNISVDRERLKREIECLASICTVSGSEHNTADEIKRLYGEHFDSIESDAVGNHILFKSCGREGAPKIMIDAHYDEIGFIVTEVLDGGFLRITNIGGIDRAIMQASCVTVYGKETLNGVIISTPPHLREGGKKLPKMEDMLIDVGLGYTKEELCELCPLGTPITFEKKYAELCKGVIAGPSFDNKACGAIALNAISDIPKEELAGDVYVTLSCREEVAGRGGAYVCANKINPDYAMVIDVNLADAPGVPSRECVKMGGGISISYSSSTDRALTRTSAELCERVGVDFMKKVESSSTGTNAIAIGLASCGISVLDVGLPLRNMHTYNEVISLEDCANLWLFVKEFAKSSVLAESFYREEIDI
ncbi:MAG: M20/M25/M40 family metallo-hydrolase [Ruminococcaceae bacterium]|nr:M20/M25/M40 family metallo-hydrolase [Oscillospiraceae bacterium]